MLHLLRSRYKSIKNINGIRVLCPVHTIRGIIVSPKTNGKKEKQGEVNPPKRWGPYLYMLTDQLRVQHMVM